MFNTITIFVTSVTDILFSHRSTSLDERKMTPGLPGAPKKMHHNASSGRSKRMRKLIPVTVIVEEPSFTPDMQTLLDLMIGVDASLKQASSMACLTSDEATSKPEDAVDITTETLTTCDSSSEVITEKNDAPNSIEEGGLNSVVPDNVTVSEVEVDPAMIALPQPDKHEAVDLREDIPRPVLVPTRREIAIFQFLDENPDYTRRMQNELHAQIRAGLPNTHWLYYLMWYHNLYLGPPPGGDRPVRMLGFASTFNTAADRRKTPAQRRREYAASRPGVHPWILTPELCASG